MIDTLVFSGGEVDEWPGLSYGWVCKEEREKEALPRAHLPESIVSAPYTPMHLIDSLGSEGLVLTVVLEYDLNLWYFRISVLRAVDPLWLSNLIVLTSLQFGPSHHHYVCAFSVANPHTQRKSPRQTIDWKDMSVYVCQTIFP
jgi:hypothetical protein